ncbi:ATP-binding cassette domain-containing protein [Streptomyces sp. NPDC059009]|uniref:ATP-binding cassette domain-containing protein n=1 Tax=Streptomyces sp. NPDC059009 TaxID=3346694 RepID=UPI00368CFC75
MPLTFQQCAFSYRKHQVFSGLDLEFPSGSTVLLGPNGAGKSTLLGLGASALTPASGSVRHRNLDPARRADRAAYRAAVGWMPQHITPVTGLTVREQVSYAGWLKGLSRREAWDRAAVALADVGLHEQAPRRATELSGGQLRRVGLAEALVHDAEVILMDEPTAGLDPQQRETFRRIVGRIAEHTHVIVSTHQTEDLTQLYAMVVVLESGTVRFAGPTGDFLRLGGDDVQGAEDGPTESEDESAESKVGRAYAQLVTTEV